MLPLCSYPASGHWNTSHEAGVSELVWNPTVGCRVFGERDEIIDGFKNASIYFLGDSVTRASIKFFFRRVACPSSFCDTFDLWVKDPYPPLTFPNFLGGMKLFILNAIRVSSDMDSKNRLEGPVDPEHSQGRDPFLLGWPPDSVDTLIVLNVGHHDLHFGNGPERYLADIHALVHHLTVETNWADPRFRRSGLLHWRSLTPTEHPTTHNLLGMTRPVDFYHAIDHNVTSLWRGAGFPVIDLSKIAFHDHGNYQRTLTYDSLHFSESVSNMIFGYAFLQLRDALARRRCLAQDPSLPCASYRSTTVHKVGLDLKPVFSRFHYSQFSCFQLVTLCLLIIFLRLVRSFSKVSRGV